MKHVTLAAALMIAGASFVGCDDKSDTPTVPTTPAPAPKADGPSMIDTAKEKAASAQQQAVDAKDAGVAKATEAKDAGAAKLTEAQNTVVATAQKYYDQAKEMIAKRDFAGAQDVVGKLEGIQAQLPAEWQTKITELKTMLTNAKASAGNLMPK